jgi:hypothetical protein
MRSGEVRRTSGHHTPERLGRPRSMRPGSDPPGPTPPPRTLGVMATPSPLNRITPFAECRTASKNTPVRSSRGPGMVTSTSYTKCVASNICSDVQRTGRLARLFTFSRCDWKDIAQRVVNHRPSVPVRSVECFFSPVGAASPVRGRGPTRNYRCIEAPCFLNHSDAFDRQKEK